MFHLDWLMVRKVFSNSFWFQDFYGIVETGDVVDEV